MSRITKSATVVFRKMYSTVGFPSSHLYSFNRIKNANGMIKDYSTNDANKGTIFRQNELMKK